MLGSLPGEASLALGQYYGNPRNQFWRLMETVIAAPLVDLSYTERLAALVHARVGLWDAAHSARRDGSLDSAIRDVRANDLAALVQSLPDLRAVAFNGGKAAAIGRRAMDRGVAPAVIILPSSSPAHTLTFDLKAAAWAALAPFLKDVSKV